MQGLLDVREGERPWAIRDELGQSMLENFGVFRYPDRMEAQIGIIAGLRERYERGVVIEDKGRCSTATSRRRSSSAICSISPRCMLQAGLAREESRGAHSRPSDFPDRDDESFLQHSISRWNGDGPELS